MSCGSFSSSSIDMNIDLSIKIIKEIQKNPIQSQRKLSMSCGVNLGSVHYCISALIEKGYVKLKNFRKAQNKLAYAYILTPSSINLKKELTLGFLRSKQAEYVVL